MKRYNRILVLMMTVVLMCSTIFIHAGATGGTAISQLDAQNALIEAITSGKVESNIVSVDVSTNTYKTEGGGYKAYIAIVDIPQNLSNSKYVNKTAYDSLTSSAQKQFLTDMYSISNAILKINESEGYYTGTGQFANLSAVTDETVQNMNLVLQNEVGLGSAMLMQILDGTDPNFVAANQILTPFKGPFGTFTAVLAILAFILLGGHMALDILYMANPSVQLFFGAGEGGGDGKGGNKLGRIISKPARYAVEQSENGGGGDGKGAGKNVFLTYLGKRWLDLLGMSLCVLYLVSGKLFPLIADLIDLVSGLI